MKMSDSTTFCPHCQQNLSKKSFIKHKRLYYDSDTDQWMKKRCTDDMFDFQEDLELLADESAFDVGFASSSNEADGSPPPIVEFDQDFCEFLALIKAYHPQTHISYYN